MDLFSMDDEDDTDAGPPKGFLTRFLELFEEKAVHTQKTIEELLIELGWCEEGQ